MVTPHVAITVVNSAGYKGYQVKGKAVIIERGKQYDALSNKAVGYGQLSHPDVKYEVLVTVNKIIDVSYGYSGDRELGRIR